MAHVEKNKTAAGNAPVLAVSPHYAARVVRNAMSWRKAFLLLALFFIAFLVPYMISGVAYAQIQPASSNCASNNGACNVCISQTANFTSISNNLGLDMVQQVFIIINKIINKIESSFYNGIVNNNSFQQIIGVAFTLYILIYGIMILFNLASYRSGEVAGRLIKIAIVYAMTSPTGWTFFSAWMQQPILKTINELIVDISNAGSGGASGGCISAGNFSGTSGTPITLSGGTSVSLATGPLAMLFGPMSCAFASKFVAGIMSLMSTGFYGWVMALMLLWALAEFAMMIMGAIFTYVKAIVGLTFLFGLGPIFFAFYLFQKTRALTMGWLSMVAGFALQPVMLFTFLAFYAAIIGSSLTNMFTDSSGSAEDICYVPWYTMPGMFQVYWWRFTNKCGAAGGQWLFNSACGSGGSGFGIGDTMPPPAQMLNVLYFLSLTTIGKNFAKEIENLSQSITGGRGGGVVSGREVGSWFKNNITGGKGPAALSADMFRGGKNGLGKLFGGNPAARGQARRAMKNDRT